MLRRESATAGGLVFKDADRMGESQRREGAKRPDRSGLQNQGIRLLCALSRLCDHPSSCVGPHTLPDSPPSLKLILKLSILMPLARPILAALVFLLGATTAHGQQATVTIQGTVRNAQGAAVRGATVPLHGGAEPSTVTVVCRSAPGRALRYR